MPTNSGIMDGEPLGFGGLFDKFNFIIPEYQRDYEWDSDHIFTFYKDVKDESVSGKQYFFGPIVLVSPDNSTSTKELIDGQQRLTSASILAAVIADMIFDTQQQMSESIAKGIYRRIAIEDASGQWIPKITPHDDSTLFYKKLLQIGKPDQKMQAAKNDAKTDVEKSMCDAYQIFYKQLSTDYTNTQGSIDTNALNDLVNKFFTLQNFVLLHISVPSNEAAWKIFINLNTKQQNLQLSNLVKAVLLSSIPITGSLSTTRADYTKHWSNIISTLDKLEFNQFLHHYFVANKKPIQEKDLYQEIVQKYSVENSSKQLIEDLVVGSENYRICTKPTNADLPGNTGDTIEYMNSFKKPLGIVHAYPILLAGYTKYYQVTADRQKFYDLVEITLKFFIRARTICSEEPGVLETFSSDICNEIRNGTPFQDIKNIYISAQPSEQIFVAKFKEKNKYQIQKNFFILEKINQWGFQQMQSDLSSMAETKRSVEHIMPETLTPDWRAHIKRNQPSLTDEEIDQLLAANIHRWGNLSPLHRDSNSALSNLLFHEKDAHPKGYKASNAKINQHIETDTMDPANSIEHANHDSQYNEMWWDFKSIEKRTETLAVKAEKIFKVT